MGIAQELDQTVDAFRNNPAGLTKSQQLAPSTIKLLALERIKREMDAKTNDINMSMSQNPKTIAQRKESEVLEGVMGVLNNNQAKKQSNMNKVASQGVAGQNAPNMLKMAGGGIVGFAGPSGSVVQGENYKEVLEQQALLRFANVSPEQWATLSDNAKQEITQAYSEQGGRSQFSKDVINPVSDALRKESTKVGLNAPNVLGQLKSYIGDDSEEYKGVKGAREAALAQMDNLLKMRSQEKLDIGSRGPQSDEFGDDFFNLDTPTAAPDTRVDKGEIGSGAFGNNVTGTGKGTGVASNQIAPAVVDQNLINLGDRPDVTYTAPDRDTAMKKKVEQGIGTLIDTDADKIKDYLDVTPEKQAEIDQFAADRKGITASLLDPQRRNRDALKAGLLAGPSSTAGGAFRNMGRAMLGAEQQQDATTISEFDANKKIFDEELSRSQGIKKEAVKERGLNIRQGISSGTLFSNQEQQNLNADAKNTLQAKNINARGKDAADARKMTYGLSLVKEENRVKIANQLATNTAEANRLKLDYNKIVKEGQNASKLQTLLGSVNKGIQRAAEVSAKSFKDELGMAQIELRGVNPDTPQGKAVVDKINDIKGRQRALYDLMVEGYNKQRADILQKLGGSSSNKDYSKADEIASKSGA